MFYVIIFICLLVFMLFCFLFLKIFNSFRKVKSKIHFKYPGKFVSTDEKVGTDSKNYEKDISVDIDNSLGPDI